MRGHIRKRGERTWEVSIVTGYAVDAETGKRRQLRRWVTVHGTKKQAEAKLAALLKQASEGAPIEPAKLTVREWLEHWLKEYVESSTRRRLRTQRTYKAIVEKHLIPALGDLRLKDLRPGTLQAYYNKKRAEGLSDTTLSLHHVVMHGALKVAVETENLLFVNPAARVADKPRPRPVEMKTWTAEEARKVLGVAREEGPMVYAFFVLALEGGLRKGELLGLRWEDVDWKAGALAVRRTLIYGGSKPVYGPVKNAKNGESGRRLSLSPQALAALRALRKHQAEAKLRLGELYHDHGLVFAKEPRHVQRHSDHAGEPYNPFNFGQRVVNPVIEKAKVPKIRLHDFRHTCATLLLQAGVSPKVVQERLGHHDIGMTLNRYAHVTPDMQQEAARKLGDLLSRPLHVR